MVNLNLGVCVPLVKAWVSLSGQQHDPRDRRLCCILVLCSSVIEEAFFYISLLSDQLTDWALQLFVYFSIEFRLLFILFSVYSSCLLIFISTFRMSCTCFPFKLHFVTRCHNLANSFLHIAAVIHHFAIRVQSTLTA